MYGNYFNENRENVLNNLCIEAYCNGICKEILKNTTSIIGCVVKGYSCFTHAIPHVLTRYVFPPTALWLWSNFWEKKAGFRGVWEPCKKT